MEYNINLSEAEDSALSYVALDQNEWIQNVVHERCRIAIDEIIRIALQKSIDTSTPLPTTKDEIVMMAFKKGWVKTVEQQNIEAEQNRVAQ